MKLDIGCGTGKVGVDWVGVDISPACRPDVVMDVLTDPWPWKEVDEIRASHFIEHVPMTCWCCRNERDPLIVFMEKCYDALKVGGKLTLIYPSCRSDSAYQDPTHRRFISRHFVAYLNAPWRKQMGLSHYDIRTDFDITEQKVQSEELHCKDQDFMHYHWNVEISCVFTLKKVSPIR
jgi:SAM-dependent methyltransferase